MSLFTLLYDYTEELVQSLATVDLANFLEELCKHGVVTKQAKEDIAALDCDRLDCKLRVRYLLQLVSDKVREDKDFFYAFLVVLGGLGGEVKHVYDLLNEACRRGECELETVVEGAQLQVSDRCLTEQDVPGLVDNLLTVADKWEEISIALKVPHHVRKDLRNATSSCPIKLSDVLHEWIVGGYRQPTTLATLQSVLRKPLVAASAIAGSLSIEDPLPLTKKPRLDVPLVNPVVRIWYQSLDTVAAHGKSTLLEVQVRSNSSVSYQWVKDGLDLCDGDSYQSTTSSILLVRNVNAHVEGRYVCRVNGQVMSNEAVLTVDYPDSVKQLRTKYAKLKEIPTDSWPPIGTETFIELALIKRKQVNVGKYDYSIQGDMDDILKEKEKIDYLDAFGSYERGAVVLVEGRPGCGKTTLAHKITRDWIVGRQVLVGAKLVYLVSLRVLNSNRKDGSLLELLEMFYSGRVDVNAIVSCLECEEGEGVVFIFDGLDEYQPYSSKVKTVIRRLIEGHLNKAMVIVFSRPVGSAQLRRRTDLARRIEILGFKKDEIYSYINGYFQDSDEAVELKEYLKLHINVLHMCYLPVHAAMICYIYSQSKEEIPNTETKIYECFTMLTIIRKLHRNDEVSTHPTSLFSLDPEIQEQFHHICQLAFEMTTSSKQVFVRGDNDVQLSDSSGSDGPSLGLVTVDSTAKLYNFNDLYAFLHLTFQEYLTALHISQLDKENQLKTVHEHQNKESMLVVWKFYCGMMSLKCKTFHDQLLLIFGAKRVDTLYRVHCAFESQQVEVCDAVLDYKEPDSLTFRNKYFTPGDYNAISYVISTASIPTLKLALYSCKLDEDGVQHMVQEIRNSRLEYISTLLFHRKGIILDQFKALNLLLSKLHRLEVLDLSETALSKNAVEKLTNNISLSSLKTLKIRMPLKSSLHHFVVLPLLRFNSPVLEQVQYSFLENVSVSESSCRSCLRYAFSCTITRVTSSISQVTDLSNQEINMLSV